MLGATLEETTFTQELFRFFDSHKFLIGQFFPSELDGFLISHVGLLAAVITLGVGATCGSSAQRCILTSGFVGKKGPFVQKAVHSCGQGSRPPNCTTQNQGGLQKSLATYLFPT